MLLTCDSVDETSFLIILELAKFVGYVVRIATYRVKFGYMVESRSIIFSKLLEGLALSAAAAATGAAALGAAAAAAAARPASAGLSPLTAGAAAAAAAAAEAVAPAGGAPATGPPTGATAGALGRGGSDALDVGVLLSTGGWGWFCCCPGTWEERESKLVRCGHFMSLLPKPG